jgi:hypothetical protein
MPIPCARCSTPLPKWELAKGGTAVCTMCGSDNRVSVFPAALGSELQGRAETAIEGEAACYDHPGKRAVSSCSQCGRFVCRLCSVRFGDETWCPTCVAAGAGRARHAKAITSRNLYDSMVLVLPLASLLIWPFTIIAAPAALVLGFMKWREPISLVRRNRWRLVLGMAISAAEIAAWVWGIAYFLTAVKMRLA